MGKAALQPEAMERLAAARNRFGREGRAAKRRMLERCAEGALTSARVVAAYHDALCFIEAHPDDPAIRKLAHAELGRVAAAARRLAARGLLADTGIPGTVVETAFSRDLTAWLLSRFGSAVEVAWEDGSAGAALDEVLALCVPPVARDGLLDPGLSTQEWLALAAGGRPGADLAWLLSALGRLPAPPDLLDHVFDSLDLRVRWRLDETIGDGRFPPRRVHWFGDAPRRDADAAAIARRPAPAGLALGPRDAAAMIDLARTALARRGRETDPLTWANPREVTLVRLEEGIDVALFGMEPDRRLPLESFFGYLAARNGVPVAYGGGWVFFDRGEIGINVFDPFRGGGSAHLFAQILRVYRHHYGVRRFLVDPFQFGRDNREGIRSGAFWFYYRLGFRPVTARLAETAAAEWRRIERDRSYRSPAATLRRLATGKLELDLAPGPGVPAPDPVALGLAATAAVGERFGGDGRAAARWAIRRAQRALGTGSTRGWPPAERESFERLALVVAHIGGLADWPAAARRTLVSIMRAKGGPAERPYAVKLQAHARLREALAAMSSG